MGNINEEKDKKRVFVVSNNLCNGCANCLMWCSFSITKGKEFNPTISKINLHTNPQDFKNIITVDCDGSNCLKNKKLQPICVEMCPTGTLIYVTSNELKIKKRELKDKAKKTPIFKLIAPWKYPFPWNPWQ